jgi:endonuclease/exonuclease/phosphatase (EEP) superfamily protein YafD
VWRSRWRPILAWVSAGSWSAWALVRLTGADRLPGFAVLAVPPLSLTPYIAAAAPLPILVAASLRQWRATVLAGVAAAGLAVAVLPRALPAGQPHAAGPNLKVLAANLMFSQADPQRVVDLVRRTGADLLSVEEFTQDAADEFDRRGLTAMLPYHVLDARWGPDGSGLYSRYPLRALPPQPGAGMSMPNAEVTLPGGRRVLVTVVHPLPPIKNQYGSWHHDLTGLPSPAPGEVRLLLGDFNATLDHWLLRSILGRGYADAADQTGHGLVPSWGVSMYGPPLTIDHLLADRRCAIRRYEAYDLPGSDHQAVFAALQLP